jgi:hypothetical protein
MNPRAEPTSLFANLPVGRSSAVRGVLFASVLLSAACLLWIEQLRLTGFIGPLAPIFYVLFAFYDYGGAMLMLGILLVAMFVPGHDRWSRLLRWLGTHPLWSGAAVTVVWSLGAIFVYRDQPLSMDEYAAVFQSQVFATGHLAGSMPVDLLDHLVPEGFQNLFLNVSKTSGEVSSSYWPSFALLLTPFTWLGIPWACNPVLSGLTVLVLNRLALRLFGSVEAAGMVTLFTLASPVFFADGVSYYSMTAHLLANSLFMLLVLQPTPRRLLLAGVVGSVALTLHNPVPHILFAVPWFSWLAAQPRPIAKLSILWAAYLPLCILLGLGWFMHSGSLASSGGPVAGSVGSLHSVANAFAVPTMNLYYARLVGVAKILLWSSPCVFALAFAGAWRARHDARLMTLLASAVLTFVGYLFVWADQGHGWGFRYFHSAWLVLPLLATAFLFKPHASSAAAKLTGAEEPTLSADLRTYMVVCAVLSLVTSVGLRAAQISEFIGDHLDQLPHYAGTGPRVVVIAGVGFYPYDLVQNDPFLRKDEIRMVDLGAAQNAAAIQRHFPGYHAVYRDDHGEVWSAAPLSTDAGH